MFPACHFFYTLRSGSAEFDLGSKGCQFETHRRRVLEQDTLSADLIVLIQTRKTGNCPNMTENC